MKKTARAHTNIALIKYWGKADAKLRIPLMSSLSMTLDAFYTDTSLEIGEEDGFYLNGQFQYEESSRRVLAYLDFLREKYQINDKLIVKSQNHVPTSAGLASSSSAFAALAASFAAFYDLDLDKAQLSRLARMGSGSASRSIYGGFAIWQKGFDDASSYAFALDEEPDIDLQLLAVEINQNPKKISSTQGMQQAISSPFFKPWVERNEVELNEMVAAIRKKDFSKIGSIAELNANEMHAINLTAKPEFTYFEPNTIKAIKLVEKLRNDGLECYYTIDAGPNVKILTKLKNVKDIKEIFMKEFPNVNIISAGFGPGISILD